MSEKNRFLGCFWGSLFKHEWEPENVFSIQPEQKKNQSFILLKIPDETYIIILQKKNSGKNNKNVTCTISVTLVMSWDILEKLKITFYFTIHL